MSSEDVPATATVHSQVIDWFAKNRRALPWRSETRTAWGVFVSEVMLQQTPVKRVLPVWEQWMLRWPEPTDLARETAGEAVRAWDRLGYPRRALRLHASATHMVKHYDGKVPESVAELRTLPGIGDYTAAAVAAFAFGKRTLVLDTNIRRVITRIFSGAALPRNHTTAAELRAAESILPHKVSESVSWNAAAMELGALVCTARSPQCESCPVRLDCLWRKKGYPEASTRPKAQAWEGTDRQLRGAVMAVLRTDTVPIPVELFFATAVTLEGESRTVDRSAGEPSEKQQALRRLHNLNTDPARLEGILESLITDGLAQRHDLGLSLPH